MLDGTSDDAQNLPTQSLLALVLAFALPRTIGWWSPTWVPWALDSSVGLQAKLADMCSAPWADSGTPILGPVERKTHLGSCGCGLAPTDHAWGGLHPRVLAPSSFLDVCVTLTLSGVPFVTFSMHRLTFLKSTSLSSSSFQKPRSFDVARITLFQGRLGTMAKISGFVSWNCPELRLTTQICIWCRPERRGAVANVTHDSSSPEHFPTSFQDANAKNHCGPRSAREF